MTTHCGRCALEKVQQQVKGIARIYVRPLKPDSSGGGRINAPWVIYIVPKGHKLKEYIGRANWSVEVPSHPMKRHICSGEKHGK